MKLTTQLKEKIDNFFDSIEPEELYRISVEKYGFIAEDVIISNLNLDNLEFQTIVPSDYFSKIDEIDVLGAASSIPLAA